MFACTLENMAVPSELTLDCKPHHSFSMLLKSFRDHHTDQTQNYKLEDFVSRLEEERLKIDAFKRELPLCMQLLTNAMEASRQQLEALKGNESKRTAILEEFIPLKHSTSESNSEKASSTCDKANWMISAQLWSQAGEETKPQYPTTASPSKQAEIGFDVSPKLHRNGGGAFLPFSKERSSNQGSSSFQALPELALSSAEKEEKKYSQTENSAKEGSNGGVTDQGKGTTVSPEAKSSKIASTTTQSHRKARRCWSPDLHRRFVNALQMLGGSQVATPKQIRELMKVDGLTNDEVKSHLQKYRLHTRRPGPNPQVGGSAAPQLVVLGGIWVPPAGAANTLFSPHPVSHVPPQHYCTTAPVTQDSYTAAAVSQPHSHSLLPNNHPHHHNGYRTMSQSQRSPESESIEDGKSESSSWKQGESGENEGHESKGGVISLKF